MERPGYRFTTFRNQQVVKAIVDGKLAEFKQVDSAKLNKVEDRIIECEKQKANLACIKIPETMDFIEAAKVAKKINGLSFVKEIWIIHGEKIEIIKK